MTRFSYDATNPYAPGARGIEIATAPGTPVLAAGAGVVTFAGDVANIMYVSLDHGNGLISRYGNVARTRVAKGGQIRRGDVIAVMALTPAPRLHVSLLLDNAYIDPEPWFDGVSVHLAPLP